MPRRDGTGPMGLGSMTGRGLGSCTGANGLGSGLGLSGRRGFGRGFGRGVAVNQSSSKTQEALLQEQRDLLKSQLSAIDKQLENL